MQGNLKDGQALHYCDKFLIAHICVILVCLLMTDGLVREYQVRNGDNHAFLTEEGN